jgi:hypothetical protein
MGTFREYHHVMPDLALRERNVIGTAERRRVRWVHRPRSDLKWATARCPRNGILVGCWIVDEPLTIDEPNLQLRMQIICKSLNGWAGNNRISLQYRIPNGRKVGAATRSCSALDHQIICIFNHRIIRNMCLAYTLSHRCVIGLLWLAGGR